MVGDGGGSLEVERWESTVTSAEGVNMGLGVCFFADAGTGAIVCLSSPEMERWPEK